MSKKIKQKEQEKRELLFTYWDTLPMVIKIDIPSEEILTHEVRNLILHFIRKGKEEVWFDDTKHIRHAFSAKELLDMANEKLDEEMKLQSLYFHLQKMQEFGLLDVISTLHEGRHNIAYFGRTSRGFNFQSKKDKTKYDDYFAEGGKFAQALNPAISKDRFKEFLLEFKAINNESEKRVIEWLEEREQFINENNIDSATMFSFLNRINYHNEKMTNLMKEIAQILDFDL
ncbi:MAG: hypothetical protein FK734_21185 [Asgard group archaeon]|nr:hypothetical protein [Asgard group archaeon]